MSEWKIQPRLGLEVYRDKKGQVFIMQSDPYDPEQNGDSVILIHPDNIPQLIGFLEAARLGLAEDSDDEEDGDDSE